MKSAEPNTERRPSRVPPWEEVIPPGERKVYKASGFGARTPWGRQPAVLVVDVNRDFLGDRREDILTAVTRYPFSCGEAGWDSLPHIAQVLESARAHALRVCYSTSAVSRSPGPWAAKSRRSRKRPLSELRHGAEIESTIAPRANDLVVAKSAPSAFFGTILHDTLQGWGIDTVVVTGCVTSGCVRATVVDAFSYGYRVVVPEECCFDRARIPHLVNLFDIEEKYGDVVSTHETLTYFDSLVSS